MIVREEFILNCPHSEAWNFLSDFPSPIKVMPGVVEVKETKPHHYSGSVKVHIGPCTFIFRGNINVTLINPKTCEVNIAGGAIDNVLGGHFTAQAYTHTLPLGRDRTRVTIEVHVGLGGLLGKLGWFMLRPKARQVVEVYAQAVQREIGRRRAQKLPVLQAAI